MFVFVCVCVHLIPWRVCQGNPPSSSTCHWASPWPKAAASRAGWAERRAGTRECRRMQRKGPRPAQWWRSSSGCDAVDGWGDFSWGQGPGAGWWLITNKSVQMQWTAMCKQQPRFMPCFWTRTVHGSTYPEVVRVVFYTQVRYQFNYFTSLKVTKHMFQNIP